MNCDSRGTPLTDLGAELHACKVCGAEAVLMFSWCNTCRENYPTEFKSEQGTRLFWVNEELVPERNSYDEVKKD